MATFQSTQIARGDPVRDPRPGTPVTVFGDYTVVGTEATSDIIQLVKVPSGARVVDLVACVPSTLGTDFTGTFGDGVDPDRYASASNGALETAGIKRADTGNVHFSYTADDTVDFAATSISTPTAAATFSVAVTYVLDHG
jgi:hypothetical protein